MALILGLLLTLVDGAVLSWCLEKCASQFIQNLGRGWAARILRWLYGLRCFAAFIFLMGMFSSCPIVGNLVLSYSGADYPYWSVFYSGREY